ncbi:MAG: CotH kinase family protein, partial [Bacteroidota bacterium]
LYDQADLYASFNTLQFATATDGPDWPNPPWSTELLRRLLENRDFRTLFINSFADHLSTTFRTERMLALIDEMSAEIEADLPLHVERWALPGSMAAWQYHLEVMRDYARQRPAYQRRHVAEHFGLSGSATLTVDVSDPMHGRVQVNSVVIDENTRGLDDPAHPYPWSGQYFRDVPVRLIARPAPGYRLAAWEGIDVPASDTVFTTLSGRASVRAVFEDIVAAGPEPHRMANGDYVFAGWSSAEPAGTYPPNMFFTQTQEVDPGLEAVAADLYEGPYNLESRTRIVGLGDGGFAFINTGTQNDLLDGAAGRDLGSAVLALDTRGCPAIEVSWTAGTVIPNDREYAIRLQFRASPADPFADALFDDGEPVEYRRNAVAGHRETLGPVTLPASMLERPDAQLRWKHYFTGPTVSGPRDMLSVDDIVVSGDCAPTSSDASPTDGFFLGQNYPNPFSAVTHLNFRLPVPSHATVSVFNGTGQRIETLIDKKMPGGEHEIRWDASSRPSGVYFYRLETERFRQTRSMTLIR